MPRVLAKTSDVPHFQPMIATPSAPRKVALVGYRGAQSLDLAGPFEVFSMANRFGRMTAYEPIIASPAGGDVICNSGLTFSNSVPLANLPSQLDTILVAGGNEEGLQEIGVSGALEWLASRAQSTRRIGSVCSGAFVLAAAGMLDGRRATTHWEVCNELQTFRPAVQLEPDAIFVSDPPFYTSAGITAGIDLCLSFVEADHGPQLALAIARNLVLFMRRPGGQTQYSASLNVQAAATPKLRILIAAVSADPTGDQSLSSLAERAGMTERTFTRTFQKETGITPAAFVETARVNRAKAILETSDWPLARVAERSGFGSVDALQRAFQKRVGAAPGDYRARFGHAPGLEYPGAKHGHR